MTSDARSGLPRRREPDLADLAAFTVDAAGVLTAWPEAAARLFGLPAPRAVPWLLSVMPWAMVPRRPLPWRNSAPQHTP